MGVDRSVTGVLGDIRNNGKILKLATLVTTARRLARRAERGEQRMGRKNGRADRIQMIGEARMRSPEDGKFRLVVSYRPLAAY